MFSTEMLKTLTTSAFLVLYLFSELSYGQKNETCFRKDYNYIDALESYYKFHTTPKNWRIAKRICAEEGASLFYPENSDEVKDVISFWKVYQNNTRPDYTWVYVGISDIIIEGEFETIDGKPISEVYSKWKLNQPDNTGNEDCVHLNQIGQYNDIPCDKEYNFICKTSILSLHQNYSCPIEHPNLDVNKTQKFFRSDYNYIEALESFYKIHTIRHNWVEAKQICAMEGAKFWHPDNEIEARTVISFWSTTQPDIGWVYVGLSDLTANGLFETIDGKSVSEVYKKWQPKQPDNRGGMQHCVYMYKNGYLDDYECRFRYSFICKKSLKSLQWNHQCNMSNLDYTFYPDIGKCYKLHTTPLTWTEAYAMCRYEQSNLAVISYQREANHLAKLVQSIPNPRVKENYQRGMYHVGFHNKFNKGWQTVKGTPMNVSEDAWWDHYHPAYDRDQCGSMFYTGRLTNIDCDMKSFFICEHELDSF